MPQQQKTQSGKKPTNPFGKPSMAKGDGTFEFQLPDTMGQGRGRIPKGKYIGRCTSIVSDTSKSSGNPMWVWEFVITKGPHAGRDFKLWTVLTDDAAWKVAETMTALGVDAQPGEKIRINKKDVIGVGCTMHIKDDAGRDGDGEFSKLDKISAHPNGAGFRSGGGALAGKAKAEPEPEEDDTPEDDDATGEVADDDEDLVDADDLEDPDEVVSDDDDEDLAVDDDEDVEEEAPPPRRPATKQAPKPATRPAAKKAAPAKGNGKGGKAPPSLGRKR